jgi:cytochrome c553
MMQLSRLFLILTFLAVPLTAFSAGPEVKKAKTVDELAAMYDVSSCKQCHAKIYAEWEKSIHSRSLIGSGRTVGGVQGAIKNWISFKHSGVKEAKDVTVSHWTTACFRCHLPQIEDATDEVAAQ